MLIAIYWNHHHLPFWHSPKQPELLFDPRAMARWRLRYYPEDYSAEFSPKTGLLRDSWLWPVFMGLHSLDVRAIAHVSAFYPNNDGTCSFPKRVWVQITTIPGKTAPGGIPLVIEGGKVTVKHLWGGDNGTYMPYQLLGKERGAKEEDTPAFWGNFFAKKLEDERASVQKKALEMANRVRMYEQACATETR